MRCPTRRTWDCPLRGGPDQVRLLRDGLLPDARRRQDGREPGQRGRPGQHRLRQQRTRPNAPGRSRITLGVVAARQGDLDEAVRQGERALDDQRKSLPSLLMVSRDLTRVLNDLYPDRGKYSAVPTAPAAPAAPAGFERRLSDQEFELKQSTDTHREHNQ